MDENHLVSAGDRACEEGPAAHSMAFPLLDISLKLTPLLKLKKINVGVIYE